MTAPVTPVVSDAEAAKVVRAGMQADLGNHVVLTLETYFSQDDLNGSGKAHALVDDLYAVMRRQRAKGEVDALMKARTAAEKVIADYERQMTEAEATFQSDTAALRNGIDQMNKAKAEFDAAARQHWADNKRGEFKPDSAYRNQMSRFDGDRDKIAAQIKAKEAERDKARATMAIAMQKQREEIMSIDLDLAERNKLLNGGASE